MAKKGPSDSLSAPVRTEASRAKSPSSQSKSTTSRIGSAASAQRNSSRGSKRSSDSPPYAGSNRNTGGTRRPSQRTSEAPPHAQKNAETAFYNADPSFRKAFGSGLSYNYNSPYYGKKNERYTAADTVRALENSPLNLVKTTNAIAGGISDLAKGIYNDPFGTIKGGISSLGDAAKNAYNQMSRAAAGDPEAVGPSFMTAASILPANAAIGAITKSGLPANSVGSLIGRNSSMADVEKARRYAEAALDRKFSSPEERLRAERDVFEKTAAMTPEGVSGYQRIVPGQPKFGFEAYDPMELRTPDVLGRVKSGVFGQNLNRMKYSEAMRPSLTQEAYPDLRNVPLGYNPSEGRAGGVGAFYPAGAPGEEYYAGIRGLYNYARDQFSPSRSMVGQPSIEVNAPIRPSIADRVMGYWDPADVRPVLAHEVGHYTSRAGDLYRGGSPDSFAESIKSAPAGLYRDPQKVNEVAFEAYQSMPGEFTSNKIMDRLNLPVEAMKNWHRRFAASFSQDEIDRINRGIALRRSYGLPIR